MVMYESPPLPVPIYYHGTNSHNLANINREGLCPASTVGVHPQWEGVTDTKRIYVATKLESAMDFAEVSARNARAIWTKEAIKPIIFEIDATDFDPLCQIEWDPADPPSVYPITPYRSIVNCPCIPASRLTIRWIGNVKIGEAKLKWNNGVI